MLKHPRLSVIIPIYKAESFLSRCVDSILIQTFSDFELLLIDDGSPDRSGLLCDEYTLKDPRVRVFHKKNGGVSSARNLGLDNAVGDYITFVDSDDWLEKECYIKLFSIIDNNELDVLQFSYREVYANHNKEIVGDIDGLEVEDVIKSGSFRGSVWSGIFKRSVICKDTIRFNPLMKYAEDQLFVYDVLRNSTTYRCIPDVLYNYFQNQGSALHNPKYTDLLYSSQILSKYALKYPYFSKKCDEIICYHITLMMKSDEVKRKDIIDLLKNISNKDLHYSTKIFSINRFSAFLCYCTLKLKFNK